eukprot:6469648-Amphidinium_carterae.1
MWSSKPAGQFLYLKKSGRRKTLLQYNASRGFPQCTVSQLKSLHKHLNVPSGASRLQSESDLLDALLPFCLPAESEETIRLIKERRLGKRKGATRDKSDVGIEENPIDEVPFQEVLEQDDVQKLKQTLYKQLRERQTVGSSGVEPQSGEACASTDKPAERGPYQKGNPLPEVPVGESTHSLDVWRSLCPQIPGVKLRVELNWHTRYKCHYPAPLASTTSKSWGYHCTQHAAAMHCVAFLWHQHWRATGTSCPWEFDNAEA